MRTSTGTRPIAHAPKQASTTSIPTPANTSTSSQIRLVAPSALCAAITRLAFTPIRLAMRGFSAVARIARPSCVLFTSSTSPVIIVAATTRIRICLGARMAPKIGTGSVGSRSGKTIGFGFQMIIAIVCSTIDMPIAVISGARRGALRRGR